MKSKPAALLQAEFFNFGDGDYFYPGNGRLFGDWSCLYPSSAPLARAGFGVVQVATNGALLSAIYGNVFSIMSQDSLSAEFAALSCVVDNSRGCDYYGDCA